jgi:two-component system cell cycle response regulator CtrA
MRALIVEDDILFADNLSKALHNNGIVSDICPLGEDGLLMMDSWAYDICIVDLGLPDIQGNELIQKIRFSKKAKKNNIPILVLSSFQKSEDKVKAFMYGADDFVTKPYENNELAMRILALIRRSNGHTQNILSVGEEIQLNLSAKEVKVNNNLIDLSSKEYNLFELLVLKKGNTLSKQVILDSLYGGGHKVPTQKIVDVLICKIRSEIAKFSKSNYLKTVWGMGYKIDDRHEEIYL